MSVLLPDIQTLCFRRKEEVSEEVTPKLGAHRVKETHLTWPTSCFSSMHRLIQPFVSVWTCRERLLAWEIISYYLSYFLRSSC